MKALVAAFNQEKALVGAFSVITNLQMQLFEALITSEGATAIVSASPVTYSLPAAGGRVTLLRRVTLCHAARDISAVTSVAAVIS